MQEPVLVHQSTYTKAEMVSTEDGMELRITTDICKLKKDYPFKLPDTVTSHIPMELKEATDEN